MHDASTALLTDRYELTMLDAAFRDGTAHRRCVFELFARRLPAGRRFGVVAGTGRFLESLRDFRFGTDELAALDRDRVVSDETLDALAAHRFRGDISGYAEGDLYFAGSPVLTVIGTFAEAVLLETLALSILNHDSAVAAAASRMRIAAGERPLAEMGSRRTDPDAAVAAARAAYIAGFDATSNLEAGRRWGIPTMGTAAHAWTLLHDSEEDAFRAQLDALGPGTTLLVDTYDVRRGVDTAVRVGGTTLGGVRIDSGDLPVVVREVRAQLDALGATTTRITVTSDLDEHAIAALASAPVDAYGVGTSLVTGSGAPTAGMVYKLVAVEDGPDGWRPVAKRSTGKTTPGGRKHAARRVQDGTAVAEVVTAANVPDGGKRPLQQSLVRGGDVDGRWIGHDGVIAARTHHSFARAELPHHGLGLAPAEPAIPTVDA